MTKLKIIHHKIIQHYETQKSGDCAIGKCENTAHHHLIVLGDEVVLCDSHFEQFLAEAVNMATEWQERGRNEH